MHQETASLSQMQDHAVLKNDEVSLLVPLPAASAASTAANPGATAAASRWAVAAGPSLPAARLKRSGYPPTAVGVQNHYNNSSNNRNNSQ